MKVLITGADGFVGSRLVPYLASAGHSVTAAIFGADATGRATKAREHLSDVATVVELDVREEKSVAEFAAIPHDAFIHLAAISSGTQALRDPTAAWEVNALGTARLAERVAAAPNPSDRTLLLISTGEVYGKPTGQEEFNELSEPRPVSPYAASKLGGEVAALEVGRRTGLKVVVARPFGHTGAGQETTFVVPAFAKRIKDGKAVGAAAVPVGNLECVRDFLSVQDVVEAYRLLLEFGEAGEIYNIASGQGTSLRDIFLLVADAVGARIIPEVDSEFVRTVDIPYLVGNASKLQRVTGWKPTVSLQATIQEVVDACS